MTQPENTTLQYGDMDGNIAHLGVLASNTYSTTNLSSTLPTTSTGSSLGHYHYTETGTNALQFLNASGSGVGGHKFYNSNTTDAPVLYLTIDKDEVLTDTQFKVSKDVAPIPTLLPLPNITTSIDIALYTASSVQVPPYNMTPNNSVWPVQVNSNCTNMVTGVTYYAKVFNATTLQMNSSPDGGVPTIIDAADLASRPQPILSLVTGLTPVPSTSILSDTLEITLNTDVSVLSATDLTFNGTSILPTPSIFSFTINSLSYSFPFVSTGLLTSQSSFSVTATAFILTLITPTISTSSMISATLYRDNVFSPLSVSLTANSIVLLGNFSGTQTIYFSGILFF